MLDSIYELNLYKKIAFHTSNSKETAIFLLKCKMLTM